MEKTKKTLCTVLLLWLIMSTTTLSLAEEAAGPISTIYLKDGTVINCEMGWIERDTFFYQKYGGIIGIPSKKVDIEKTLRKHKELMSKPAIVTPEQERNMRRAEGEQLERVKKYKKQYKRLIELEKKYLKDLLEMSKEKYRTASGPPPKGYMGFNEKEAFKRQIKYIEKKIEELEKDPEYYFYEKRRGK